MFYTNVVSIIFLKYESEKIFKNQIIMKQGDYIQASKSYIQAFKLDPQNPLYGFNLAKALAAAGNYESALYYYQQVAGKDQFINHQIYYHMGNSFYGLRRYSEAMDAYNKALQLRPDYREARQALINTRKIHEILKAQQKQVQ